MKKQYQNEGYNQYMTIELGKSYGMEQKMLLNNEIAGLLPCRLRMIDGGYVLDYQIDGMISLKEALEQKSIDEHMVQNFLESLIQVVHQLHSYLLRPDGLLLEMDSLYMKGDWETIQFCYVPDQTENLIGRLKILIESFMKQLDHKDEKTVLFVYNIYRLLGESNTSIATIEEFLRKEKRKKEQADLNAISMIQVDPHWNEVQLHQLQEKTENRNLKTESLLNKRELDLGKSQKVIQKNSLKNRTEKRQSKTKEQRKKKETQESKQQKEINKKWRYIILQVSSILVVVIFCFFIFLFAREKMWKNATIGIIFVAIDLYFIIERKKEKGIVNQKKETEWEEDKTILLSALPTKEREQIPYLRLLSKKGESSNILLSYTPLILGSLAEAADQVIEGKGVSRIHASIEQEDGKYYIRDLNSTNGTYWNGELLMPQVPKQLTEADNILLGDQAYQFCIEKSF